MVIGESTAWIDTIGAEDSLPLFEAFNNFEYFGTVARSSFSLFQICTLSQWAMHIVRPIMEKYPIVLLFFIFFIFMTTYGLLNVVVANLVNDAIVSSWYNDQAVEGIAKEEREKLCEKIGKFFKATDINGDGTLTEDELANAMRLPKMRAAFQALEIPNMPPGELLVALDINGNGELTYDEFVDGIMKMRGETGARDMIILQLEIQGLTTRVQVLEKRLEQLSKQVRAVGDALRYALDGVRSALKKADYTTLRNKQLEFAKVGRTTKLTFDEDVQDAPTGEHEAFLSFTKKLLVPAEGQVDANAPTKYESPAGGEGPSPHKSTQSPSQYSPNSRTRTLLPDAPKRRRYDPGGHSKRLRKERLREDGEPLRPARSPAQQKQKEPQEHHSVSLRRLLNAPVPIHT